VKCNIWSLALSGAETWTLQQVDQKQPEISEMWCYKRMEKVTWIDSVINEKYCTQSNGTEIWTILFK
jgi:uncharacterized GH25 family protein